ncbi:MAG TPA: 4-alpha-glucanotransferase [Dongiaceae bacterium]|nr:4-alpha-glucanotransferase [Dongiaceae bacterium]
MAKILKSRRAGVLLHATSLPGPQTCGSLGADALRWIDWLAASGFRLWQVLPLTPVSDGSPYNSYSAFAGYMQLIDIAALQDLGFPPIGDGLPDPATPAYVSKALQRQFDWFQQQQEGALRDQFRQFTQSQHWLENYCLFSALKEVHPQHWEEWPAPLRDREPSAIKAFASEHQSRIDFHRFAQFIFMLQWQRLKQHANSKGIALFGDMPIFVAHDSVDVWSHRDLFKLDAAGHTTVIAGVPPDYFSAQGQRWGNPLYAWDRHAADDYQWWRERIGHSLTLYDAVRIDHFRGFMACWEIPASESTAINGTWVPAPGDALFASLQKAHPDLPLIAEDLGLITPDVIELRRKYKLPGMKILQFAFDSDGANPYLPHNHSLNSVVYSGTHDNNTTLGWFQALNDDIKRRILEYYAQPNEPMPWPIIKSTLASPGRWAILPLQDLLALGTEHRMNVPGTTADNWRWRFDWQQVDANLAPHLNNLNRLYYRI